MPRWERSIDIQATPEAVWAVLADIEGWPGWTPSIISAERVDAGLLARDSEARVQPRGTPKSLWKVSEVTPNRSFTWGTRVRGAQTTAGHTITPTADGSRVTLTLEVGGVAAKLLRPIISRPIVANLNDEAEGLKRATESRA